MRTETQQSTARPRAPATENDPRWQAVVARDAAANGTFYYSVSTTGVYCVPSCATRLASPEHVRFHETREDAERAGFRPCKRCKPDTRGRARERAPCDAVRFSIGECSLGLVLAAQSATGLTAVLLGTDRDALRRDLRARMPRATLIEDDATLGSLIGNVVAYVDAPSRGLNLPLDPRGTEFQKLVWRALCEIPAGSTASYTDIAKRIGRPTAARAVAQACAANALAVVVPCHRVVRSNGTLSGYRWGIERKRELLDREAAE